MQRLRTPILWLLSCLTDRCGFLWLRLRSLSLLHSDLYFYSLFRPAVDYCTAGVWKHRGLQRVSILSGLPIQCRTQCFICFFHSLCHGRVTHQFKWLAPLEVQTLGPLKQVGPCRVTGQQNSLRTEAVPSTQRRTLLKWMWPWH
jgi:hypothetical protein